MGSNSRSAAVRAGLTTGAVLAGLALVTTACGSSSKSTTAATTAATGGSVTSSPGAKNTASAPGVTATTIKLGVVASLTGFAAPSFGPDVVTGVEAAVKQINAKGGIDGRTITITTVDDTSSPTQDLTAVRSLISDHVFGIVEATPFFFGGYAAAVKAGIPVTGSANDGPEWGSAANSDLFSAFGSPNTNYATSTMAGDFLKSQGVTKLAAVAYGDSPSSLGASAANSASAKLVGIPTVYKDISQNVGETNFAPDAVAIKSAGVDGLEAVLGTSDNISLLGELKTQGVKLKGAFIADGYQQAVLASPTSIAAASGDEFASRFAPTELQTPATKAWQAALSTYGGYTAANPTQGLAYGWFSAQTMIQGLKVAGQNPTWASFIAGLHKVTGYTAGGLLAPISYGASGAYDSLSAGNCWYVSKVVGSAFVPVTTKPVCGKLIANTHN